MSGRLRISVSWLTGALESEILSLSVSWLTRALENESLQARIQMIIDLAHCSEISNLKKLKFLVSKNF